eukprot:TRINITY_DN15174_c0_g1_i1.p2 TRINITY_DN15174_c0_g1~~TRINITY_DN15174_c0_g1_i1.p2  ORF type:complete len:101 (-),score=12.31 TRINITY_DN15174_c0_g1_i1:92-394(-)
MRPKPWFNNILRKPNPMGLNKKFQKFKPDIRFGEVTGCASQFANIMDCIEIHSKQDELCTPHFEIFLLCMEHEKVLKRQQGSFSFQLQNTLRSRWGPKGF